MLRGGANRETRHPHSARAARARDRHPGCSPGSSCPRGRRSSPGRRGAPGRDRRGRRRRGGGRRRRRRFKWTGSDPPAGGVGDGWCGSRRDRPWRRADRAWRRSDRAGWVAAASRCHAIHPDRDRAGAIRRCTADRGPAGGHASASDAAADRDSSAHARANCEGNAGTDPRSDASAHSKADARADAETNRGSDSGANAAADS
jgi:hypothetical protein